MSKQQKEHLHKLLEIACNRDDQIANLEIAELLKAKPSLNRLACVYISNNITKQTALEVTSTNQ